MSASSLHAPYGCVSQDTSYKQRAPLHSHFDDGNLKFAQMPLKDPKMCAPFETYPKVIILIVSAAYQSQKLELFPFNCLPADVGVTYIDSHHPLILHLRQIGT